MRYRQPFDQPNNPDASYQNASPALGIRGSILDIIAIEQVQREILKVIAEAGIAPSDSDLTQLWQAIQSIAGTITNNAITNYLTSSSVDVNLPFGTAGGTADAITSALSPAPASLYNGLTAIVKLGASANATTTPTFNANGLGAKVITRTNTAALDPGDLPANGMAILIYDLASTSWMLAFSWSAGSNFALAGHGQCYFSLQGGNLVLKPKDGNGLYVNGAMRSIPSAGVSIAPTGLTPGQVYYFYAWMNGATMTLEASTTAHATGTDGVEYKSGDTSRTLVGKAVPVTGPAFADTDGQLYVLSWFKRKRKRSRTAFTAAHSTTSSSYVEIHSEIRNGFITWSDEEAVYSTSGGCYVTGGQNAATSIGFDGITPEPDAIVVGEGASGNDFGPVSLFGRKTGLVGTAAHYATLLGAVDSGSGTVTYVPRPNSSGVGSIDVNTRLTISVVG